MSQQTNRDRGPGTHEFPDAFASLFGKPDLGEPIAKGKDAVMTALKNHFQQAGSPIPSDKLAEVEQQIAEAVDDVTLHIVDGDPVITATIKQSHIHDPDLEGLARAMSYSDRHGGRSAFDGFGGMFTDRRRADLGGPMKTLHDRLQSIMDERKKSLPLAPILLIACPIASGALLGYSKEPDEKALAGCKKLVKNLQDAETENPVRFGNLSRRLKGYGFHLASIRNRLEKFVDKPTAAEAVELSNKLALMAPALICVMKDTSADIAKMQQI